MVSFVKVARKLSFVEGWRHMQTVFKRYEKKYLITKEQYSALLGMMISHNMEPGIHSDYLVQNLYFDTDNWDVARAAMERPFYKEKMRLRYYGPPGHETDVFLELKKKYKGVVYKRRISIPYASLSGSSVRDIVSEKASQISRELEYYLKTNEVSEKIYIAYQRAAFTGAESGEIRVTFDTDIRCRFNDLDFTRPPEGRPILTRDNIIMEIKAAFGMPFWMARALSEYMVFPMPFSKFGICYTEFVSKREGSADDAGNEGMVKISA